MKAKLQDDRHATTGSNEVRVMDFVQDQTALVTKMRILTIIETFTRFSPPVEPRFRFTGADAVEHWNVSANATACRNSSASIKGAIWVP